MKAPPEAVIQKGVQERVEAAVGIALASDEIENLNDEWSLWDVHDEGHHCAEVKGCPAEQAHTQDSNHHQCDLFFWLCPELLHCSGAAPVSACTAWWCTGCR